uniref:Centrobin, centriole duplication and spindle assembly protein n=2 Tax=Erpetoichthys calabaricus TaxID=27687 RepID=A0A8C4X862_ERPCA
MVLNMALQSEDLLSDVDLLPSSQPCSAPNSPRWRTRDQKGTIDINQKPLTHSWPSSPYSTIRSSNEVSARLHMSLRNSIEVEGRTWSGISEDNDNLMFGKRNEQSAKRQVTFNTGSTDSSLGSSVNSPLESDHYSPKDKCSPCSVEQKPLALDSSDSDCQPVSVEHAMPCALKLSRDQSDPRVNSAGRHNFADIFSSSHYLSPRSTGAALSNNFNMSRSDLIQSSHDQAGGSSEMETLAQEITRNLQTGIEISTMNSKKGPRHITDMENIRSHLQNFMKTSLDKSTRDSHGLASATLHTGVTEEKKDDDSFDSDSTGALLNAKPMPDISPPVTVNGLEDLFPRYSRMRFQCAAVPTEIQILKDTIEKERTRRKHCERQIQTLQNKILELQQQLAIAVSADRKKNIMIEQLDKTLASVVDSWKKNESEKSALIKRLKEDNDAASKSRVNQQEFIQQCEERLLKEQKQVTQLENDKRLLEDKLAGLSRQLELSNLKIQDLQRERDEAVNVSQQEQKRAQTVRTTLEEQRDTWGKRERELEEQLKQQESDLKQQIEKEKTIAGHETQRAQSAHQVLLSVKTEVQKLESELEKAQLARDNFQMELNLAEARFEAERSQMQAQYKVSLEQQLSERLAQFHKESAQQSASIQEQHRKQILELSAHHDNELTKQLAQFKSELQEREERQRRLVEEYEIRLTRNQEEISSLRSTAKKLESQKSEMVNRLQSMMRAHWDEARRVLLLDSSPKSLQKKEVESHKDQPLLLPEMRTLTHNLAGQVDKNQDLMTNICAPYLKVTEEEKKKPIFGRSINGCKTVQDEESNIVPQNSEPQWTKEEWGLSEDHLKKISGLAGIKNEYQTSDKPQRSQHLFSQAVPLQPAMQLSTQKSSLTIPQDCLEPPLSDAFQSAQMLHSQPDIWNSKLEVEKQAKQVTSTPPDNFAPVNSTFHTLFPSNLALADLSQFFNHSLLSHQSFVALQPQLDESTRTDLAEHPLSDNTDETSVTPSCNSSRESSGKQPLLEPSERNKELQHYIQMLLGHSSDDLVEAGPCDSERVCVTQTIPAIHHSGSCSPLKKINSLIEHKRQCTTDHSGSAGESTVDSSSVMKVSQRNQEWNTASSTNRKEDEVLSSKQISDISRLLELYHSRPEMVPSSLYNFLKPPDQSGLKHNLSNVSESAASTSAPRSGNPKEIPVVKKEVLSPQTAHTQRRSMTVRPCIEKCQPKPGKKPVNASVQGSKCSRGLVWK